MITGFKSVLLWPPWHSDIPGCHLLEVGIALGSPDSPHDAHTQAGTSQWEQVIFKTGQAPSVRVVVGTKRICVTLEVSTLASFFSAKYFSY